MADNSAAMQIHDPEYDRLTGRKMGVRMGLIWNLLQQSQISNQKTKASSLENRVEQLETDLNATRRLVRDLVKRLDEVVGEDTNKDGKIGYPESI